MQEIEFTARVPDLKAFHDRRAWYPTTLAWSGFTLDTYYDDPGRGLQRQDAKLRIREKFPSDVSGSDIELAELTWKGPKQVSAMGAKIREELSYFMVNAAGQTKAFKALLAHLDFMPVRAIHRYIEVYRFDDLQGITFRLESYHTMDHLLELEVQDATPEATAQARLRLDLDFSDRNLDSYVAEFEARTGQTAVIHTFQPTGVPHA